MRPVLLRVEGFAAFRQPTVVDFRDTDFFVLVGPTGAGKSTVIDAITFALYGSVPRWDDERAVALALAPTVARGTVSLVFDLGDERFVAARELRRSGSGSVTVKGARLERLTDPHGTAEPGEDTEPLADGAREVSRRVEALLGMPFDDFCTCVVLPQGDFADFLHAKASDRQKKLERILGMGIYDKIMKRANADSAAAGERAGVLDRQLADPYYADATPDAERAAGRRVDALESLAHRVDAAAPSITTATAELDAARRTAARLREERDRLAALRPPDGLRDLDRRRRESADVLATARASAAGAEEAATEARDRRDAAPERTGLERVRRDHADLLKVEAALPDLADTAAKEQDGCTAATERVATATAAVGTARSGADATAAAHRSAADELQRLEQERNVLGAVSAPHALSELDRRAEEARQRGEQAAVELADAERAEETARSALAAAPDRGPLERARHDQRTLADARSRHAVSVDRHREAGQDAATAGDRLAAARERLAEARERTDRAERTDLAAALRPALHTGEDCPVCAQPVATLPDPLPDGHAETARAERARAEAEHDRADEAARSARTAERSAGADLERIATEIATLEGALAGFGDAAEVAERLAGLDRIVQAAEDAARTVREARRRRDGAVTALDGVRSEVAEARDGLRTAREPLVRLGIDVPPDDGIAGIGDAWQVLLGWARSAAAARETAAGAARSALAAADRERSEAAAALASAELDLRTARDGETAAVRAERDAVVELRTARTRRDELRAALDGAPTDAEAAAGLGRLDELDEEVRTADLALRSARTALRDATDEATLVGRDLDAAWRVLRGARDPLVELQAPGIEGDDPAAAWAELVGWAGAEVAAREAALPAADAATDRAVTTHVALVARLAGDLAEHGVPGNDDPSRAAIEVARAVQEARGERERIVERRAAAGRLVEQRDVAQEEHQVAGLLGRQLRSGAFPRWLVASALDALVVDASVKLGELSGGQFSLTHDGGDFLVVDHADADSLRPVKTLSGGETFQASLSLALALSAQLSGLAAGGAPRLESIVLDEGFGTLDETNLDIVASTLETLAVTGDRMVGVITHVPALAERIPVRYVVRRNQSGSTVTREAL